MTTLTTTDLFFTEAFFTADDVTGEALVTLDIVDDLFHGVPIITLCMLLQDAGYNISTVDSTLIVKNKAA